MFLRGRSSQSFYIGRAIRPAREAAHAEIARLLDEDGGQRTLRRVLAEDHPGGKTDRMGDDELVDALAQGVVAGRYVLIGFRPRAAWVAPLAEGGAGAEEAKDESTAPKEKKWFEIALHDDSEPPVPMAGAKYRVELPDGAVIEGELDDTGKARIECEDPSKCKVSFPDFDDTEWEKK